MLGLNSYYWRSTKNRIYHLAYYGYGGALFNIHAVYVQYIVELYHVQRKVKNIPKRHHENTIYDSKQDAD